MEEEATTWSNRSAPSLTFDDLLSFYEEAKARFPELMVAAWEVHPDMLEQIQTALPEGPLGPVIGPSMRASEFLEPGYAVGKDAEGNVVQIIGPQQTICFKPPKKRPGEF